MGIEGTHVWIYIYIYIYMCLNIIKVIYDKFITNIIFDDGKLKTFH